jgi:hypothetical protein
LLQRLFGFFATQEQSLDGPFFLAHNRSVHDAAHKPHDAVHSAAYTLERRADSSKIRRLARIEGFDAAAGST